MKRKTKQWIRRLLAIIMCAVMVEGMAPEAFAAAFTQDVSKVYAEEEKEAVSEEAGLFPSTLELEPGDWFPDELAAGMYIDYPNDLGHQTGISGLLWSLDGFYIGKDFEDGVPYDSLWDDSNNNFLRYEGFEKNRTYYVVFFIYSYGKTYSDGSTELDGYTGTVKIRNKTLTRCEDREGYHYLEMTTGNVVKHKLTISMGTHGTLPDSVKDGVLFEEGASIRNALGSTFYDITAAVDNVSGYYVTGWSDGKTTVAELEDYDITGATADVTLTAQWAATTVATGANVRLTVPTSGMNVSDVRSKELLSASATQLECWFKDIYSDEKAENVLDDDTMFEEGTVYYAKIVVEPQKGYIFNKTSLPAVTVNGKKVTINEENVLNDDEEVGNTQFVFIWAFTPGEDQTLYYDIVLDYNYPDGSKYKHTITRIPEGTDIEAGGDFSILKALRYKVTEGDGISYDAYQALVKENENNGDFPGNQEYIEFPKFEGYSCRGRIKTRPSFTNYQDYANDTYNTKIDKNLTLYYFWQSELKSVKIESIVAPVCGQKQEDYNDGAGPGNGITYQTGIRGYNWKFVLSENKAGRLDEDTVFEGNKEYYILLDGFTIDEEEGKLIFDRYMTSAVKLSYNGTEYAHDENYNYLIPVKAVHLMPEDATVVRKNEVAAGCETEGSYDEVFQYECTGCHKSIEESVHKTTPALGHDWGEWKVIKEATETEEGIEERVCKRDPDHKETRKIPKIEKKEEPADPEKPEEPVQPETPVPDMQKPVVVSENKTEKINDADVTIETTVTYPKAVNWTGSKITKAQLAALSKDGVIAAVKISGLDKAIAGFNNEADLSKLFTVSYSIGKEKNANAKGSFYVKLKLNSKVLKKAKIKGADKKALQNIVKELNKQFKENPYEFSIVPVELKDAESVTIKAKLKNGEVQLNEDGTIKGLKNLKIKVAVPGLKKPKTYSFSAKKAAKSFTIKVTDQQNKKADVTALAGQNFTGSRTGVDITK